MIPQRASRAHTFTLLLLLASLLAACAVPGAPAATPTPGVSATPSGASAPAPSPTTAEPVATPTPPPSSDPTVPAGTWVHENILETLLGPAPAPPGWDVAPCPGQGSFLCVSEGDAAIGPVELQIWPLDSYPDFQEILVGQGVTPGEMPPPDDATAALTALAEQYLDTIETDRALTYPGDAFIRIEPEPVQVGQLPGVAVGFRREAGGQVEERYLNYVTFDGRVLYWVGAPYDPLNVTTFVSDEALVQVEPYLRDIVAGLVLPPPVSESPTSAVMVEMADTYLATMYGEGVLEEASRSEPYPVTGASPDGHWWRVRCPQFLIAECWLPADPARVRVVDE